MADDRHNRKDESRFKNRMLQKISYKLKIDILLAFLAFIAFV
ncbi:hypothetical protein MTBBW1_750027 [Desulfamplus magnetovallimortis]|uniref:Uncharacterized protein n=1 Tax=Desulfamplus magnetovallimortis TaxID=1246637 RepID=A0A1W1HJ90_9BACT|nr:hypothetical protein MTBBW1_750027 [Desulfamplus magnetovallimortis]